MKLKSLKKHSARSLATTPAKAAVLPETVNASGQSVVRMRSFGKTQEGEKVELYTLTNKNCMQVTIATYGATVIDILVPDRTGKLADVSLGFGSIKSYETKSPYFGATVGRFANRIAKGKFALEGKVYKLAKNDGANTLHGGLKAFDKMVWKAEPLSSSQPSVRFTLKSPDGEEGYPGNLDVAVTYTLTDKNELIISYLATTDKPTVINLTNHTYFNLAGAGNGLILDHRVKINASRFTPVGKSLLPTGKLKDVEGTPLDFRKSMVVGERIQAVGGDPVGYDHNYVLDNCKPGRRTLAAEVYEPTTGRLMKVYTDQPGIQFYAGNSLDGTFAGKGRKVYRQYAGFCLETQHYPDSPNQPTFPSTELRPGQTYKTSTVYQFSTK